MKTIAIYFIYFLLFLSPNCLKSTHIIGGTASYQVINTTDDLATLKVSFYLYRDATSPAQFDNDIDIGLYGHTNEIYEYISLKNVPLTLTSVIIFDDLEECQETLFNYALGIYDFQIDLPRNGYDYYTIAYQRCCRDNSISNILLPEETGIAISLDIYPKAFDYQDKINALKTSFPVIIEPGETADFDISIQDTFDKEYYLSIPKASGGVIGSSIPGDPFDCEGIIPSPINCPPEFADVEYIDSNNPYGPDATLELDKTSGILSVNIPQISKVLVGLTLDRYADEELVCRMRQQFIMNSFSCSTSNTIDFDEADITIWPLPVKENIHFSEPLKNVSLYNLEGSQQSSVQNFQYSTLVDFSGLRDGIYLLRGQSIEGHWVTKKVIKLK